MCEEFGSTLSLLRSEPTFLHSASVNLTFFLLDCDNRKRVKMNFIFTNYFSPNLLLLKNLEFREVERTT